MSNYYIFRIDYTDSLEYLVDEIKKGRLHQGWSSGNSLDLDKLDRDSFRDEYTKIWGEISERKITSFFYMKDFEPGDLIIVPKTPKPRHFFILEVTGKYVYDYSEKEIDDFRHVIPVKILKTVSYDSCNESKIISASFRGYQSPVNRIDKENKEGLIKAIEATKNNPNSLEKDVSNFEALDMWNNDMFGELANNLLETINSWTPKDLEDIVNEIFENNGFTNIGSHIYNCQGGDIDLLFELPKSDLLYEFFLLDKTKSYVEYKSPTLAVQVKNKTGIDEHAIEGIEQLKKMNESATFCMLLTTSKIIDDKTDEYAKENKISIIYGLDFAKLLIKYGLGLTKLDLGYKNI